MAWIDYKKASDKILKYLIMDYLKINKVNRLIGLVGRVFADGS